MREIRNAFRAMKAAPVVSAVAILSLALGIGANTAMFSILDSLLLRSLPVKDPQRLVMVGQLPWEECCISEGTKLTGSTRRSEANGDARRLSRCTLRARRPWPAQGSTPGTENRKH